MSAFICNPSHIGLLAAYRAEADRIDNTETRKKVAGNYAKVLARQNIESVQFRYPDIRDGDLPGPVFVDGLGNNKAIVEMSELWGRHFSVSKIQISPVEVIKLCHTLEYQSCETDDYLQTIAAAIVRETIYLACRRIPGYDQADSELNFQSPSPEIKEYIRNLDKETQE